MRLLITLLLFCCVINAQIPSPVGYWKLDETSGTVLSDAVGTNDIDDFYATINYYGVLGKAVLFNGVDTYSKFSTSNTAGLSEISISLWIMHNSSTSNNMIIEEQNADGYWQFAIDFNYWYTRDESTGETGARNNDLAMPSLSPGWNHLVFTYSVSGVYKRIYKNGVLAAETTISINKLTSSRSSSYMGSGLQGSILNGVIDEVGVWNQALSVTQIQALYNNGNGLTYPFSSPIASKRRIIYFNYVTNSVVGNDPDPEPEPEGDTVITLFADTYEDTETGLFTANEFRSRYQMNADYYHDELGSTNIVDIGGENGKVFQITCFTGGVGGVDGIHAKIYLDTLVEEVYFDYDIIAVNGFDYYNNATGHNEGKFLPGFGWGGAFESGWVVDSLNNGGRCMNLWTAGGAFKTYIWHHGLEQGAVGYQANFTNGAIQTDGTKQHWTVRLKVNTPGRADGIIEYYLNGVLDVQVTNVIFRTAQQYNANHLKNLLSYIFLNFWYGGDASSACDNTSSQQIDNLLVTIQKPGSYNYITGPAQAGRRIVTKYPTSVHLPSRILYDETFTASSGTIYSHNHGAGGAVPAAQSDDDVITKTIANPPSTLHYEFVQFHDGGNETGTAESWVKVYGVNGSTRTLLKYFQEWEYDEGPYGEYTATGYDSYEIDFYPGFDKNEGWTLIYY